MTFFQSLLVALSTYSIVPVPQFEWNEKNMKYAICFFPVVGILCGAALYGWYTFSRWVGVSAVLFSAVAVCLPLLLTGGIHMDGFMDTVDALASHQSRERKREILKDSHIGAFAPIYLCIYLLLNFGLLHEVYQQGNVLSVLPLYVLSRTLSALCAVNLPNARKAGMLCAYTKDTDREKTTAAMTILVVLCCAGLIKLSWVPGCVAVAASLLSVLFYRGMAMKQFGGVTGDTSGFFLQICELAAMAGIWLGGLV